MTKKKNKSDKKQVQKGILYGVLACVLIFAGLLYMFFFASISKTGETAYLYIDNDDTMDSISVKLDTLASSQAITAIKTLSSVTGYSNNIRSGRYAIEPGTGALAFFRHIRNAQQSPVKLTVPSVRTKERLAEELSKRLMMSKEDLLNALNDDAICKEHDLDTMTIVSMFIPNTYEIYWNISVEKLLAKMDTENKNFWNDEREKKANDLGLSHVQVSTLASIVEEETANNGEKPMIAGLYYNRFKQNMPLQADPTIKFALQDFSLKRIYNALLSVVSPYNTYRNVGLPPGPIRIPSIEGIDAVLNLVHHDYIYMCAKEDFSGTHNFAKTYPEHLANAAKYTKALNERGIK